MRRLRDAYDMGKLVGGSVDTMRKRIIRSRYQDWHAKRAQLSESWKYIRMTASHDDDRDLVSTQSRPDWQRKWIVYKGISTLRSQRNSNSDLHLISWGLRADKLISEHVIIIISILPHLHKLMCVADWKSAKRSIPESLPIDASENRHAEYRRERQQFFLSMQSPRRCPLDERICSFHTYKNQSKWPWHLIAFSPAHILRGHWKRNSFVFLSLWIYIYIYIYKHIYG